jgi:hypothetical protein
MLKIYIQGFDKEEMRYAELLGGFQKVFLGLMWIFMVFIQVLFNIS